MHVTEPSIRLAAVLTSHWQARDIEAVILLLKELRREGECRCQDLEDLATALLMMRDMPMDKITWIIRSTLPQETA